MRSMLRFSATLAITLTAFASAGCGSDAQPSEAEAVSVGADALSFRLPLALVRVVHASPDAPPVDVYVRGLPFPVIRALSYGSTTHFLPFFRGNYTVDLRATPSTVADPIAYSTGPLAIPSGARITAVAEGLLGSPDPASKFRVTPIVQGKQDPGAGNASVRILHAGADAPTVGIDVGDDDPASPEVPSLARFTDTGSAGIPLPAGAPLQIGVDAGGKRVTAFTTPPLTEGEDVLVIATGLLGKLPRERDGFDLLAVGRRGTIGFIRQNPQVYALHASPDAPAVDVFAGAAKIVGGLSFGQLSAPVQVPPGDYTLDFFGAAAGNVRPSNNPAASGAVSGLTAGERYLAIATGFLAPQAGEAPFQVVAAADGFALDDATNARLRVVHASPDAPAVDVGPVAGGKLAAAAVSGLAFGESTAPAGLALPAGSLTLGVAAAGSPTPVASFDVTTGSGDRAFVAAAGVLDPSRGPAFRLIAVSTRSTPWAAVTLAPNP